MSISLSGRKGQTLDILVENMGRINYGGEINENQKVTISDVGGYDKHLHLPKFKLSDGK